VTYLFHLTIEIDPWTDMQIKIVQIMLNSMLTMKTQESAWYIYLLIC
jgi:hypothetical protein